MVYLLRMVIFHGYVKQPDGSFCFFEYPKILSGMGWKHKQEALSNTLSAKLLWNEPPKNLEDHLT